MDGAGMMNFDEWLELGQENGWASKGVCATHDLLPMTEDEEEFFEEGEDPCIPAIRIWVENT